MKKKKFRKVVKWKTADFSYFNDITPLELPFCLFGLGLLGFFLIITYPLWVFFCWDKREVYYREIKK